MREQGHSFILFNKFVDFVFLGLFTCSVYILWDINKSVQTLNQNMAVVLVKQIAQGEELKDHSGRLRYLELSERDLKVERLSKEKQRGDL